MGIANTIKKNTHVLNPRPNLYETYAGTKVKIENKMVFENDVDPGPSAGNGALLIVGEALVLTPDSLELGG